MYQDAFRSLFEINMGIRSGERVLVFSDTIRIDEAPIPSERNRRERLLQVAEEAARFAETTYGRTDFVSFPATAASGAEPPETLWRSAFGNGIVDTLAAEGILPRLLAKEATADDVERSRELILASRRDVVDVVVALANNSTSHTRFRSLVNAAGGRFASLPHFDPEMFFTSMQVDWHALAERTKQLAAAVNEATEILIETPNGTRMRIGKAGRQAEGDDGLLTAPGSFGNLPAGEVYLAPLEGTSEGVMVLEYGPTRKLSSSVELIVRNGIVTDIRGDEPHREWLERRFAENGKNRNIAELGIGTNDRATRPDNILEAEKILGTIHIALGDNSGFGGTVQTPFHEDYVFYRPTLTAVAANGSPTVLLRDGTLLL
ncbi:leucyl aminopeptidase (aminopeptidase T)-like protein [Geobacter metallireducens RCH3]|uniref:Leucyl aminopeptidase-related protein n=2 Tax=Geobacter metallireducens TaxID=28232 RepID=Q39R85_GEOMG|nr:leucyl aminopeptidase-related protein [Geobacter metallireducens GS-15]EHP84674.1 leucyl aminopeptidase (aminopeptidase T)-like protein [Geobacter metallireducens RCH3]